MATRRSKPIRLKAAQRARASATMLAALEEKRAGDPKRHKPAIWTEEFLASGKPGKAL